jgi:hypothetical protein
VTGVDFGWHRGRVCVCVCVCVCLSRFDGGGCVMDGCHKMGTASGQKGGPREKGEMNTTHPIMEWRVCM